MAKTWYPVIDYPECMECGACISKCSHDVYDASKAPSPLVKNPEACIDHCHGCGNICPAGAITYAGDSTGWMPKKKNQTEEESGCSCGCSETQGKKVLVEYLYLDLDTCDRCIGTDNVLDEVMMVLTPLLQLAGYEVKYKKVEIETAAIAAEYRFLSSPTIRVNTRDICASVEENNCSCCSEISGTAVNCRVFKYNGENYEVPPKEMIADAILRSVFGVPKDGCSCESRYELPENLKEFFGEKKDEPSCRYSEDCC